MPPRHSYQNLKFQSIIGGLNGGLIQKLRDFIQNNINTFPTCVLTERQQKHKIVLLFWFLFPPSQKKKYFFFPIVFNFFFNSPEHEEKKVIFFLRTLQVFGYLHSATPFSMFHPDCIKQSNNPPSTFFLDQSKSAPNLLIFMKYCVASVVHFNTYFLNYS